MYLKINLKPSIKPPLGAYLFQTHLIKGGLIDRMYHYRLPFPPVLLQDRHPPDWVIIFEYFHPLYTPPPQVGGLSFLNQLGEGGGLIEAEDFIDPYLI